MVARPVSVGQPRLFLRFVLVWFCFCVVLGFVLLLVFILRLTLVFGCVVHSVFDFVFVFVWHVCGFV
jgi:hypothetical protein